MPNEFVIVIRAIDNFSLKNFCLELLPPPENSVMRNRIKEYAGVSNSKTRIRLVHSITSFSHGGIVLFPSILLTEEFK